MILKNPTVAEEKRGNTRSNNHRLRPQKPEVQ